MDVSCFDSPKDAANIPLEGNGCEGAQQISITD
jgi:hypothetical protein